MTQIQFLDDLGRELDGAAGRLIREQRRSRFRAVLAPAAGLAAVAAIAVAVWPSGPADPEREVAVQEQPKSLTELLGVLRRPETEADRDPATSDARESDMLGGNRVVRVVGTGTGGKPVVLVAGDAMRRPTGGTGEGGVCIHYPDVDGAGVGCWPAEVVAGGRAYGSLGKHVHGVVPDGVVEVRVVTASEEQAARVRDNFFQAEIAELPEVVAVILLGEDGKPVALDLRGAARVPVAPVPVPDETLAKARALAEAPDPPELGERLPGLRDLLAAAAEAARTVPHPPAMAEDFAWEKVPRDPTDFGSINYEADVRSLVEFRAKCMWQRYWLAAVQAGDDAVAAQARQVLETMPRWPALRSDRPDDSFELQAFAVANDQVAAVAREVALNCGEKPPVKPPATPEP